MPQFPRVTSRRCPVFFAGFKSDTATLQNNGWDLSMEQLNNFAHARSELRLAMRHEKAGLYALSAPVAWDQRREYAYQTSMREPGYVHQTALGADWDYSLTFQIIYVGSNARFQIIPQSRAMFFQPIDAFPAVEQVQELDFDQAIPFRTISAEAPELVVDPDKVGQIMELILKAQSPKQAEIRQETRRRAWRERDATSQGYDARADIRAQIVSLTA
jgi:hypothetical protein